MDLWYLVLDVVIHAGQKELSLHVDSETAFLVTQFRNVSRPDGLGAEQSGARSAVHTRSSGAG